jgi:hypothetical protein
MIASCRGRETLPEMEAASAFFDAIGPGNPWGNGGIREKRGGERRARVPKGGGGVTWSRRNRRWMPRVPADSGEKFRQPGGVSSRGTKGRLGEKATATYRRGRWEETAGIKREINRGGELL